MPLNKKLVTKLYLCNGKKDCSKSVECYIHGGTCCHTADEHYRINDILVNGKSLPTRFEFYGDEHLVESINYIDLIKWGYHEPATVQIQ